MHNLRVAIPSGGINMRRAEVVLEAGEICRRGGVPGRLEVQQCLQVGGAKTFIALWSRSGWAVPGMKELLARPSRWRVSQQPQGLQ